MNTALKIPAFAALLLVGSCGLLFGSYMWLVRGETFFEEYATRKDASEAISRGWLPESLPESARNIRSYGDLDVNYSFGSFELPVEDWPKFESQLVAVPVVGSFRVDDRAPCAPPTGLPLLESGFTVYREKASGRYFVARKAGCVLFSNGI